MHVDCVGEFVVVPGPVSDVADRDEVHHGGVVAVEQLLGLGLVEFRLLVRQTCAEGGMEG